MTQTASGIQRLVNTACNSDTQYDTTRVKAMATTNPTLLARPYATITGRSEFEPARGKSGGNQFIVEII